MIQAINGGKHVHDENVEYLKTKKLTIEMLGKMSNHHSASI